MNLQEAMEAFRADRPMLMQKGVVMPDVLHYIPDGWKSDVNMAMDAIPALATQPNSAIPAMLTTMIDPEIYEVLFTPNKAAQIVGEKKKGSWVDQAIMFPTVEHTGEVSSYGDFIENGHAGANTNFPNRQNYLFQTIYEYGELELERAGLAKINWVSEINMAGATVLNKYMNYTYFFGVYGMQNYGLLNDPNLSASLTPSAKAYGNNKWVTNGVITATANEIYADIQSLVLQLINQSNGLITEDSQLVLALSPQSKFALTATNSFNVNVRALLKDNIPNLEIVDAIQYQQTSSSNQQGIAAGNFVQLIAKTVEGQQTAYCAFSEKLRAHPLIRAMSSWKQKATAGSWGTIIRQPFAIASMIGV